jgi:hypothetical protein
MGFIYIPPRLINFLSESIRTLKGAIRYIQRRRDSHKGVRFTKEQCAWIREQLIKKEILVRQVAHKARCSTQNVSQVLWGKNNRSVRVQEALAFVLGYPSVKAMIVASRGEDSTTGGAA